MINGLMFVLGLFVTAIVSFAIWSIASLDVQDGPISDDPGPQT